MRIKGKLEKWIDKKGFGFIVTPLNEDEIFVHISAFPKDTSRPKAGELISFEIQTDKTGKKRAINVLRLGKGNPKPNLNKKSLKNNRTSIKGSIILVSIMVLAYIANKTNILNQETMFTRSNTATTTSNDAVQKFKCDGRQHCSQMNSRAEAEYFITHCPDTKMDGDKDGIPCENDSRF